MQNQLKSNLDSNLEPNYINNNNSQTRINPFKVDVKSILRKSLVNKENENYNILSIDEELNASQIENRNERLNSINNTNYNENNYYSTENLANTSITINEVSKTVSETVSETANEKNYKIDLNNYLFSNPDANFLIRVKGDSMNKVGIETGDLLVVNRTEKVSNNKIVVASLNNDLLVKRINYANNSLQLISENEKYKPIIIHKEDKFDIWGVVKSVIKSV